MRATVSPRTQPRRGSSQPLQTQTSYRRGPTRAVLAALDRPEINLVAWQRRLPASLRQGLADWAAGQPTSFDDVIRARDVEPLKRALAGMPPTLAQSMTRELSTLLSVFADVSYAVRVRAVFGVVRTDRCRKFHVDYVRHRLITTYVGPGTQWLPEQAVDRCALAKLIASPEDANRAIARADDAIEHDTEGGC